MFGPLSSADYPYHFLPCPASALPREEHGGSAWGGSSNPAERTSKKAAGPAQCPATWWVECTLDQAPPASTCY